VLEKAQELRPVMKWTMIEITAKMISKWIRNPLTWKTKKPPAQRMTRIRARRSHMRDRLVELE
jgi:hypothetical protein